MEVEVTIKMKINPEFYEELSKILDHKIEWLIDLYSNPEIESVYDCSIKKVED